MKAGGDWVNPNYHFDNVFNSMISFLKIMIGENWVEIMYHAMDVTDSGDRPLFNYSRSNALIFYILVIVGNTLILNLFIGLIILNY